ncbi:MAG: hypothetical protein M1818_002785 [Claussenomyces sp. TS43310]|nr:MAG: hypothetical protein M1818_002785 [Claussenomyces sp. TS43310]
MEASAAAGQNDHVFPIVNPDISTEQSLIKLPHLGRYSYSHTPEWRGSEASIESPELEEEKITITRKDLEQFFKQKVNITSYPLTQYAGNAKSDSSCSVEGSPFGSTIPAGTNRIQVHRQEVLTRTVCSVDRNDTKRDPLSSVAATTSPHGSKLNPRSRNQYCWYFITPGKHCRHEAKDCSRLHEMPPSKMDNTTAHDAKITCWFWATKYQKCSYEAGNCKYAHSWTGRVARKPTEVRNGELTSLYDEIPESRAQEESLRSGKEETGRDSV